MLWPFVVFVYFSLLLYLAGLCVHKMWKLATEPSGSLSTAPAASAVVSIRRSVAGVETPLMAMPLSLTALSRLEIRPCLESGSFLLIWEDGRTHLILGPFVLEVGKSHVLAVSPPIR